MKRLFLKYSTIFLRTLSQIGEPFPLRNFISVTVISIEEFDRMREDIVAQCGHEGPNASVLFTRKLEGKECVTGVRRVVHNAGSFVEAV